MFYDFIETENASLTGKVKVHCITCYCFLMISFIQLNPQ